MKHIRLNFYKYCLPRRYFVDENAKKTALRMIPYGLYVLTAETSDGRAGAATVNWVTQSSFQPPLVVAGVKMDSGIFTLLKESNVFALNMLGKDQKDMAFQFFKPAEKDGDTIGGAAYRKGANGAPILEATPAFVECKVREIVAIGDHAAVVGEVLDAGLKSEISGRPDDAILILKDLGEKTFYGG